ncbi:MAG: DUF6062 family protein [Oscillospiraceae bacterium]|jgi:hypothetical protein|nr:DUF6062 family protein [Oscillospiraceae bacterium]
MRYQLDTIPLWDAYKQGGECPLCALQERAEQGYAQSFLGESVMEPAARAAVNEKGFCGPHFALMFRQKNRLGLALMAHTHLLDVMEDLSRAPTAPRRVFGHPPVSEAGKTAGRRAAACALCDRLAETMRRYAYTLAHLWAHDAAFCEAFAQSKGLCLPHMALAADMAAHALHGKQLPAFLDALDTVQRENLARLAEEVAWFTQKFDYRNSEKPWGDSRDALERAIYRLRGFQRDMSAPQG